MARPPTFKERFDAVQITELDAATEHWQNVEAAVYAFSRRNVWRYRSHMLAVTASAALRDADVATDAAAETFVASVCAAPIHDECDAEHEQLTRILEDESASFNMEAFKSQSHCCKKCGAVLMVTFKQTRSADEGMTMITLPCAKCEAK